MTQLITCIVNDTPRRIDASGNAALLTVLREDLGLKATRFGCGAESCGACTVLVDGAPRLACTLPVAEIDGCAVQTAEGLAAPEGDHPLLAAFLRRQAGQCGYCLPGILMRARALLESGATVDRAAVVDALDGNLCRCGAHGRIIDAVLDAATRLARLG